MTKPETEKLLNLPEAEYAVWEAGRKVPVWTKAQIREAIRAQGGGATPDAATDEDALIALVAGPYHYHHKMDNAAEREGKAFDRCRELTIQNIRTWCATQRAIAHARSAGGEGK